VHELRSARLEALRNAAHYESNAVPLNMIVALRRRDVRLPGEVLSNVDMYTRADETGKIAVLPIRKGLVGI